MIRCIKQPTSSVLKLFLLGCSLLLLPCSPALAQGCTQAEIKTNIAKFDDIDNTTAKQAIVQCGSKSVYLLIEALKTDKSAAVREGAAVALWSMGEEAYQAVPGLIKALRNDDSATVRSKAASALGLMGEASYEAIPDLIDALKDKSAEVRANGAYALGNLGKKANKAVPHLIEALRNDKSAEVRANAAYALGNKKEAAKSAVPYLIEALKDETSLLVRITSVNALEQIAEKTKDVAPQLIERLRKDKSILIRIRATEVLGEIGEPAKDALPLLIELLKDSSVYVRYYAASALGKMGTEGIQAVPNLIEVLLTDESIDVHDSAASALVEIASKLGKQKKQLTKVQLEQSILEFETVIQRLEQDTEKIFQDRWIESVRGGLYDLQEEQDSRSYQKIFREGVIIWLTHMLFWLGLILLYPKSPQVQAIFFWNPWVRKFFGLGYVGIALTWIPFLRSKLFAPFQESLLSDADLENFDEQAYFPNLEVERKGKNITQPIQEAIPDLELPIVLEGESGLGKSMFLRHLVKSSKRIIVYLPAEKCANGVIEAIQAKLHGFAQDSGFLRDLIYSDAIDICIDGLNEVTPDTRALITSFVESYFKGNIIIGTQSMEWQTPSCATTYVLQPLKPKQIEKFLLSRYKIMPPDAPISGIKYKQACEKYIDTVLHQYQSEEEQRTVRRMLSNPMDLTIVAQMIAHGQKPDLLNLQQQQYQYMAQEYEQLYLRQFPLEAFAETVYQMRLQDEVAIPADKWFEELICMERHKMVFCRLFVDHAGNDRKEWYFRHDKIQDFFIVQTFLGEGNDLPNKHISDPRFRGVYFLLATLLPWDAAWRLRETLIQYAANTKDHTVSDNFVQLLLSRQAA
ncbi:HEAT repeat domain-containing protein [Moorena producens JHB]|uniref:HEAT repeat domain-containing protein n=1 Tax=Moorena producens (strain JHB) TaxID=1454205 RepID=A0A1D9G0A0_MOOP1|nr:HEAT repeat domain-containing protein [Moorena producens]AOY81011.1 HEAT repeat domain-containing protein [Moorena producens JHB]